MLRPASRTGLFQSRRPVKIFPVPLRCFSLLASPRPAPLSTHSTQLRQSRHFTSSAPPNSDRLTWDEFLRLRRQRRLTDLLAAIPSAALGIYGGFLYFGSEDIDPAQTIGGFDPFLMNTAFVVGCGLMGWLVGPTVGKGLWRMLHQNKAHLIDQVTL
jgi:import inner membrane translocase subunit TIM23